MRQFQNLITKPMPYGGVGDLATFMLIGMSYFVKVAYMVAQRLSCLPDKNIQPESKGVGSNCF